MQIQTGTGKRRFAGGESKPRPVWRLKMRASEFLKKVIALVGVA